MITHEEAIQATNLIFEFCCQQKDCKSCPFLVKRFFVPEQGYKTCGLHEEPCAWNRFCNENICSKGITQWLREEHKDND